MTKQKYKKINLLLDSDVSFTQQMIKEELGLHILPNQLPTFKMFMVNFAEHGEPLAFSVGNNQYPPRDFNIHKVTYSTVQGVVKKLDEAKLAKFFKGKPQGRAEKAELSRLKPSKKLMNWLDEKFPYADSVYLNPQTHVRLRNSKKTFIDYKHTFYTKHVDLVMKHYHQKLNEWGYSLDGVAMDKLHMYCNFGFYDRDSTGNPNIRYGGRWWGEHNQIPSKERTRRISFDLAEGGTDLIELDFTASILTAIRYWELGREPEKDHYKLFRHDEYVDRQHMKNLTQMMLNRKRNGLVEAYKKAFYLNAEGKPRKSFSLKQKVELHWLPDTAGRFIAKMHSEIRHWFGRGQRIGQVASFIETNLVLEIVRKCCNENIPVLTVYDSFIVPKKHKKRVYELMYEEDVFPFVRGVIEIDEQDSVERIFMGRLDWNKPYIKKLSKMAEAKGLELVDTSIQHHKYTFKFKDCGHLKEVYPRGIKETQPKCQICFEQQLHDEAFRAGLTIVSEGKDTNHRLYRFIKCGHEQEFQLSKVRTGSIDCKQCWFEQLQVDSRAYGLNVIKRGRVSEDKKTYWYECEFIECGHKQMILAHAIRSGAFICRQCEKSALDFPSKVYLFRIKHKDLTWLKLGHARYLKRRINEYRLSDGASLKQLKTIDFDTGREARQFENKLHKKYKSLKISKQQMKKYMRFGFNECYKLEALDKLLEELESV